MNKTELKKILKPLIKECIKEVIFEEKGALSHIISEVAQGLGTMPEKKLVETQPPKQSDNGQEKLQEHRKRLLDAIGKSAYGGVNVFEGTKPAPAPQTGQSRGPLSDVDPSDPGVDIANIFGSKSSAIFNKMMGKK